MRCIISPSIGLLVPNEIANRSVDSAQERGLLERAASNGLFCLGVGGRFGSHGFWMPRYSSLPQVCISFFICSAGLGLVQGLRFLLCYSCAGRIRVGRISKVTSVVTAMIIPPMNMASTMPEVKASFDPWIICCEMSSGNCPATI